jgi:hypothetical protein
VSHTCHAHGCPMLVPPSRFACAPHWYSLRKPMRDAIWRHYRSGQENRKDPSASYMAVQQRAVGELAFRKNDEEAARIAAPYLLNAEVWRATAIARGEGDPLEGLTEIEPRSLEECRQAVAEAKRRVRASAAPRPRRRAS